jgi:hypothetical protein
VPFVVLPNGRNAFVTSTGAPASGYKVYTYVAGTSTPKDTYTSYTGGVANTNPIVLDARGEAAIYWIGTYDVVLKDAAGSVIWGPERVVEPASYESLSASSGSSVIGFIQSGSGASVRTAQSKMRDWISVKDYGAVGDGSTNDTTAITNAIAYASSINATLLFPSGTYLVTPATAQTGAASYNCCFVMPSNMHLLGEKGATIKLSDNYSTDGSPKELAIFSVSASAISNISFVGLVFNMNGANNSMSPARPSTYNTYNHAAIMANGPSGRMSEVLIENCTFQDNAGVCFVVCQLVAVGTTPNLGVNWVIRNNYFKNGGVDSADHTSIYAFCEDVLCDGNLFWQDNRPHTTGKTGGASGYEVHGSNQRFVNNYVYNYTLGAYVASNFTNTTLNTVIANNHFYCSDYGILLYRGTSMTEIDGVVIANNTIYFDNYTYSGQPTSKNAIAFQGTISTQQHAVKNIKIDGNYAIATYSGGLLSQFVRWNTVATLTTEICSNISITNNQVIGFTDGVYIICGDTVQGLTEISNNQFIELTPDSLANPSHGIFLNSTAGTSTLVVDGNQFIDERGSPQFANGIYITAGTITDFYLGPQVYKGVTTNYTESSLTVTNWKGPSRAGTYTITYSASMTPDFSGGSQQIITATNGTAFTINAPIRPVTGAMMTITIRNTSGGALGAITWNGIYGKSAFTAPATANSRSITFCYSGSLWIQVAQTGVDVPN